MKVGGEGGQKCYVKPHASVADLLSIQAVGALCDGDNFFGCALPLLYPYVESLGQG